MDSVGLHNEKHRDSAVDDEEGKLRESHHSISKGVLDDTGFDEIPNKNQVQETSLLSPFQPDAHIYIHYVKVHYCGPPEGSSSTTRISEKTHIMQWRGEHFKCRIGISLECSTPKNDWTIGIAQACDFISLRNYFDKGGYYSWEFHPLKSGLHSMVNDSNGSQWPFYSHRSALIDLKANTPIKSKFYELRYSDYFYPTMHWSIGTGGMVFPLTHVSRRQSFKIWFVAIKRGKQNPKDGYYSRYMQCRPEHDQIYAMKSMEWRYNIDLKFDTQRPLGSRCVSIEDKQEEQPQVFDSIEPMPTSALMPPNCNSCQSLIFYPTNPQHPLVLRKEPEEIVVPWSRWRKDMTQGYRHTVGFGQPNPLPRSFPNYPTDPVLSVKKLHMSLAPMPRILINNRRRKLRVNAT